MQRKSQALSSKDFVGHKRLENVIANYERLQKGERVAPQYPKRKKKARARRKARPSVRPAKRQRKRPRKQRTPAPTFMTVSRRQSSVHKKRSTPKKTPRRITPTLVGPPKHKLVGGRRVSIGSKKSSSRRSSSRNPSSQSLEAMAGRYDIPIGTCKGGKVNRKLWAGERGGVYYLKNGRRRYV